MTPKKRPPTHPGQVLLKEFLEPRNLTCLDLANASDLSAVTYEQLIYGLYLEPVSPMVAAYLGKLLGTTPEFWLNLQTAWDLWHITNAGYCKGLRKLKTKKTTLKDMCSTWNTSPEQFARIVQKANSLGLYQAVLVKEFTVSRATVDCWACGTAIPHVRFQKLVVAAIERYARNSDS